MGIPRKYAKWLWAAVAGTALFAGINAVHGSQQVNNVSAMTARMKTVCVGRVLVDLPDAARISFHLASVDGFDISRNEETADQFSTWLAGREAELATKPNRLGVNNIESSKLIRGDGFVGKIFVHSRYRSYDVEDGQRKYHETVSIEGHVHKEGTTFSFDSEGDDPRRVPVVAALMAGLLKRANGDVPSAPGFCINRAILTDAPEKIRIESVPMFASFPGHPDVVMAFSTNSGASPSASLLERTASALEDSPLTRVRSRVLRERSRTINGLRGEEFAIKVTELNFTTGYSFDWEMQGKQGNFLTPSLSLEMRSGVNPRAGGKPVHSSLSEDAMLSLWDKISSSIRLQPSST